MPPKPTPTRILITRHGESEHNLRTDVFMGRSPASRLTETGHVQARRLGGRLKANGGEALCPDHIICSSLPRTLETAQEIATQTGVDSIFPEDAFWELNKGDWEGVMDRWNIPEPTRGQRDGDPFGFVYPGGESYQMVWQRAAPAFDRWVDAYPGATLLFVLHGDVMRSLLYHMIRFPPEKIEDFQTDPCALNEFRRTNGRYMVVRLNDTGHLG